MTNPQHTPILEQLKELKKFLRGSRDVLLDADYDLVHLHLRLSTLAEDEARYCYYIKDKVEAVRFSLVALEERVDALSDQYRADKRGK